MGMPPSGNQVTITGILTTRIAGGKAAVIYRFAGGKIVEAWYCGDMLGLWQQLGLTPPMMKDYSNVFFMALTPGLNMISLPLEPAIPFTARSLAEHISATMVIRYDQALGKFVGFTLAASDDGFPIQGGEGYIVNVPGGGMVAFVGAPWTRSPMPAAPPAQRDSAWAFVVSGSVLDGEELSVSDGNYTVNVKNLRTWIPFHLKNDASVSVRIYSINGQLIRILDLGHRDAGVYVSRSKAAYWDGKNEAGEEVASGIYFYSITAGDLSVTRKMTVRK
jgi:hypothetical protein